jgi:hypothetical protein
MYVHMLTKVFFYLDLNIVLHTLLRSSYTFYMYLQYLLKYISPMLICQVLSAGLVLGTFLYVCSRDLNSFYCEKKTWDRCYDFKNIFAENFWKKIGVFDSKQS